ncbi:C1 family peptidase [Sphingomonas sp. LT1P40]|uniref:C1 family peptidase n=1 Tax=Alteristakelama amylovorans TaxID=3096166 RepID=UPI002FCB8044
MHYRFAIIVGAAAIAGLGAVGAASFAGPTAGQPGVAQIKPSAIRIPERAIYSQRLTKASPAIRTQITQLRSVAVQNNWTFNISYTEAMDRPLSQLAGLKPPTDLASTAPQVNSFAVQALQLDKQFLAEQNVTLAALPCAAGSATCSYQSAFGPVRNQGGCGSCWAFATMGAYEGSYRLLYGSAIDSSEQHVLSCSGAGTCGGGWWAFPWLLGTKDRTESQMPYTAANGTCTPSPNGLYRASAWGYVGNGSSVPSVAQLKAALAQYGPLAVAVRVTPAFQAYGGGVFNQTDNGPLNHGVTLIGWDDSKQAWLIRNSWGAVWGDGGNMWIRYGSNRIGYAASWVRPVRAGLVINPKFFDLIRRSRLPFRVPEPVGS